MKTKQNKQLYGKGKCKSRVASVGKQNLIYRKRSESRNENTIVSALLCLDSISHEPIKLYINSPGGAVSAGYAIIDTMHMIEPTIF